MFFPPDTRAAFVWVKLDARSHGADGAESGTTFRIPLLVLDRSQKSRSRS